MDRQIMLSILLILCVFAIAIPGCRRRSESVIHDALVEELNRIRPGASRLGAAERVESVLRMLDNGVMDSQPFLVLAVLQKPNRLGALVVLSVYDEDMDTLGLAVQEERIAPDGTRSKFVEEYPVFVHRPISGTYDYRVLPVRIRDSGQQKDLPSWQSYVMGEGVDLRMARNNEYYRETLPSIWMSVPEPNTVDVYVFLYDRAGNRSDPVRLEY